MRIRRSKSRSPSLTHGPFPITFDDGDLELHPITPQMPKKISRFSLKQFTSPVSNVLVASYVWCINVYVLVTSVSVVNSSAMPTHTVTGSNKPIGYG